MKIRSLEIPVFTLWVVVCLFMMAKGASADEIIPIEVARKAALSNIPRASQLLKEWEGAFLSPQDPIVLYDLKDVPYAYMFAAVNSGNYVGYITISARWASYPVLEYSTAPMPMGKVVACKEVARKHIGEDLSDKWKFIHLGLLEYLVKFESVSGDNDIFVGLSSCQVFPKDELNEWQSILEKRVQYLSRSVLAAPARMSQSTSEILQDVEAYTWYRGCYPTTMAMILNYHGSHGFPNLWYEPSSFHWNGPNDWLLDWIFDDVFAPRELIDIIADNLGLPKSAGSAVEYGVDDPTMESEAELFMRKRQYTFDFNYAYYTILLHFLWLL